MKGFIIGLLLGGFLVFILLAYMGILMSNNQEVDLTGNAVNTQQSNQVTEQVIINNEQKIKEGMIWYQTFEVFKTAKVSINLTSDELVNYALLPDYETDHYVKAESYKSFANKENVLFIQDAYNLDVGKYSVVITSLDKPVNVHLVVKAIEL